MIFDAKLIAAVIIGLLLATFLHAQEHKVTLHGKLYAAEETDCTYYLEPDGDSEGITLSASGYLCDYMHGSETRAFVIVLGPADK